MSTTSHKKWIGLSSASQAAFRAAEDPASIFVKNKHLASAGGDGAEFASWPVAGHIDEFALIGTTRGA